MAVLLKKLGYKQVDVFGYSIGGVAFRLGPTPGDGAARGARFRGLSATDDGLTTTRNF